MSSDGQWVPDELWADAVGELPPRSDALCRHAYLHYYDMVMVNGAAIAAVRCGQCSRILGVGSDS